MERRVGRIWISLLVVVIAGIVWVEGESLRAFATAGEAALLTALTQLGILYIVALFVERALEVLIKAWRQGEKVRLQQQTLDENDRSDEAIQARKALEEYRSGTQRRALLVGLTLGILVSLSGIRILGPIFEIGASGVSAFQSAVFHFTDIVITAGLIAGGSATIHELMALIDDFLKASRRRANQE